MNRYTTQHNNHDVNLKRSRANQRSRRRGKKGFAFLYCLILILAGALFFLYGLNGNLSELPHYFENRFHPSYDRLPTAYSPFAKPSVLAESLYKQHKADYSDSEKIQIRREPASVEFFVRLHSGRTDTLSETEDRIIGGFLPHYVQWDQRWAFHNYIDAPLAVTGCGPCCLSMVYTGLTGNTDLPPDKVADFALENGYYVEDVGTAWSLFDEGATQIGLNAESLTVSPADFESALDSGKLIILSLGPGDFTTVGHFIVVWSHAQDNYQILDPFNVQLSRKTWKFTDLARQTAAAWAFSANR